MTCHDATNPCASDHPEPSSQTRSRNPDAARAPRLSRANTVVSTSSVSVIALIDSVSVPVPASVTGLESATNWLERNFRDAGTAAFYRAERIADHPTLISGGVYAPTTELAFLTRQPAS